MWERKASDDLKQAAQPPRGYYLYRSSLIPSNFYFYLEIALTLLFFCSEDRMPSFESSTGIRIWTPMLVNSFSHPKLFLCTPAIGSVLQFIMAHDDWEIGLRTQHHALLDQLIAFVTTHKTPEQISKLEADWSVCSLSKLKADQPMPVASTFHKQLHEPPHGSYTFEETIEKIFTIVTCVVDDMKVAEQIDRSVRRNDSPGLWPVNESLLVPSGAENTVSALLRWYRRSNDTHMFRLLALLCRNCSSLPQAVFANPDVISTVVDRFKGAVKDLLRLSKRPNLDKDRLGAAKNDILYLGFFFRDLLEATGMHLHSPMLAY